MCLDRLLADTLYKASFCKDLYEDINSDICVAS